MQVARALGSASLAVLAAVLQGCTTDTHSVWLQPPEYRKQQPPFPLPPASNHATSAWIVPASSHKVVDRENYVNGKVTNENHVIKAQSLKRVVVDHSNDMREEASVPMHLKQKMNSMRQHFTKGEAVISANNDVTQSLMRVSSRPDVSPAQPLPQYNTAVMNGFEYHMPQSNTEIIS